MIARENAVIVNALVRQALVAAQEVMGENGLNAVLRASGLERFVGNFPPDNFDDIAHSGAEDIAGEGTPDSRYPKTSRWWLYFRHGAQKYRDPAQLDHTG